MIKLEQAGGNVMACSSCSTTLHKHTELRIGHWNQMTLLRLCNYCLMELQDHLKGYELPVNSPERDAALSELVAEGQRIEEKR